MKVFRLVLLGITFAFASLQLQAQVGINTTNPLSTLDINGNLSVKTVTLNGNGSGSGGAAITISDGVYISIVPQATDDKFQLPSPVTYPGRIYVIRNIQNAITAKLTTAAGMFFPKNSTVGSNQLYMYEGNLRTIIVISDGINWTYIN